MKKTPAAIFVGLAAPPSPDKMQAAMGAGKITITPDKVTLGVQMQSLPDGTRYPGTVVLAIPGSHVQVQITNSNYQKIAN
jgi:hypothetical protein